MTSPGKGDLIMHNYIHHCIECTLRPYTENRSSDETNIIAGTCPKPQYQSRDLRHPTASLPCPHNLVAQSLLFQFVLSFFQIGPLVSRRTTTRSLLKLL